MGHNQTLQYLIDNEQDARWGLTVNGVGFQHIDSDEPYPPKNHPQEYSFLADQGRRLNEYQFIYITAGRGFFQSEHCAQTEIKEGDMFLLFPREWHSYHPDPGTGWNEYWIGFRGQNIDSRIANGFFSPREPVFHVGLHDELVQVFRNAIAIAKEQYVGYQQMLAGAANMVMGHAYAFNRHNEFENREVVEQMRKAKVIMTERRGHYPDGSGGRNQYGLFKVPSGVQEIHRLCAAPIYSGGEADEMQTTLGKHQSFADGNCLSGGL